MCHTITYPTKYPLPIKHVTYINFGLPQRKNNYGVQNSLVLTLREIKSVFLYILSKSKHVYERTDTCNLTSEMPPQLAHIIANFCLAKTFLSQ